MEIHWIFKAIVIYGAIFSPIYFFIKFMIKRHKRLVIYHKEQTANQPTKSESQLIAEKVDGLTVLVLIMIFVGLCGKF